MALKAAVETLDGIPEALHEHYTETDEGFRLEIDGFDPASAQQALAQERDKRKRAERKLKAYGATPEEVTELREQLEELEAGAGKGAEEALARQQAKYDRELHKLTGERDGWRDRSVRAAKRDAAVAALTAKDIGGIPAALTQHIMSRMKVEEDGDEFALVVTGLDGEETDAASLVRQMKQSGEYDWGFTANGAAGGGSAGRGAGGAGKGAGDEITHRDQLKTPADAAAFIKEHGLEAFRNLPGFAGSATG